MQGIPTLGIVGVVIQLGKYLAESISKCLPYICRDVFFHEVILGAEFIRAVCAEEVNLFHNALY